ncbi:hypothetical protein [Paraburkholderia tropica]|uniref:hypothetical protein n=1 Tax=Paraburkholderia tropica TaxID=92647 RepID=UPI002AB6755C|nr:hypothetical protein [Paraburkholderia tropica]
MSTSSEPTPTKMSVDVLFGLFLVQDALLESLIELHPEDADALRIAFETNLKKRMEIAKKSGRSKLEEDAVSDYGAKLLAKIGAIDDAVRRGWEAQQHKK